MNIESIHYSCGDDFCCSPTPRSKAFSNWDFIEALSKATGYKNVSVTIETGGKKYILPLLERKALGLHPIAISLPLGLYGGIDVSEAELYIELLKRIKKFLGSAIVLQNPFDPVLPQINLSSLSRAYTHVIEFGNTTYEDVFKTFFDSKLRNQIRKGEKSNLTIREGNDEEITKVFYELYVLTNWRWGKRYPKYSIDFFKPFVGKQYFEIKLSMFEGKAISAIILLKLSGQYLYWFGALNKDYGEYCPNHLLLSKTIKEAIEADAEFFNFGASGKFIHVKKFKESFGAKEIFYDIYFMGNPVTRYALATLMRRQ
ncbi:MAG: peptidoglycan bridge formation glycyltransferase FemA/FemB family protein [Smithellaceae bacterium]|jgi:lipid II:glycine glycyltransferase (peptidoglycan interpeptide bridge formation enzyme)